MNIILSLPYLIAQLIQTSIKFFNKGSGNTLPGYFILKVFPNILSHPKLTFNKGVILISGTNGKTTTSKFVSHVLENSGYKVLNNVTGANLFNGIVSTIILGSNILGKFDYDYGVFEVDEIFLPKLLKYLKPRYLLLLNLSRDQLDRSGEIDIIYSKWLEAVSKLESCTLILEESRSQFNSIAHAFKGPVLYFNSVTEILGNSKLKGSFNAKNLNAGALVLKGEGILDDDILKLSKTFQPAFGRGEHIDYRSNRFKLFLAKNPESFNNNLKLVKNDFEESGIFFIIFNSEIPDGRDVSWIYDIETNLLKEVLGNKKIIVAGKRVYDFAVRLQYAGLQNETLYYSEKVTDALEYISNNFENSEVVCLPNYSAMLELRKNLTGRKLL